MASVERGSVVPNAYRLVLINGFDVLVRGESLLLPVGPQRLLALLALRRSPLLRSHVAGLLWPEVTEENARASLRTALWRLGPARPMVRESGGNVLFIAPEVEIDLSHIQQLSGLLLGKLASVPSPTVDLHSFSYDLLPGWTEDWVLFEQERFRQLRLHGLEALCERLTSASRFAEAIETGLAAVAAEPLRESAHRVLIRAHLAEGNRGEAHRQYGALRDLLRQELDVEPSFTLPAPTQLAGALTPA